MRGNLWRLRDRSCRRRIEIGIIGCEGMTGTVVVLGGRSFPPFKLHPGRRRRTSYVSRGVAEELPRALLNFAKRALP
jgi:hypothetical protein